MSGATCPYCKVPMQEGFVVDNARTRMVTEWVEGKPEYNFLSSVKVGGKVMIQIATYRCPQCGHLESYATGPQRRGPWL
jgi:hypothetical protein